MGSVLIGMGRGFLGLCLLLAFLLPPVTIFSPGLLVLALAGLGFHAPPGWWALFVGVPLVLFGIGLAGWWVLELTGRRLQGLN